MSRFLTTTWLLMARALREARRTPANDLGNAFIPLFFYAVTVGAVGGVAREAFGVDDYKGFQLPVALLQGAAGIAGGAGLALTQDIQSGYFEKLMLTSTPRFAIVLGRMLADAVKALGLSVLIIAMALAFGSGFETGPAGMAVLLVGTAAFARDNSVTYLIEGQRSLITAGWEPAALLKGAAAIVGIGAFTFTLTALALRSRAG